MLQTDFCHVKVVISSCCVTIYDVAMSVLVNTRLNVLSSVLSVATKKEGIIYVFFLFH